MKIVHFDSEVLESKKLTSDVVALLFRVPEGFSFKPGQFITIHFDVEGEEVVRQYSIAAVRGSELEVCIKIIDGVGSEYITSLSKGDVVTMSGSYGVFFVRDMRKDIVCFSVGTGVAPFLSIVSDILEKGEKNIVLIAGYRSEEDVIYDKRFRDLEKDSDGRFSYHVVLSLPQNDYEFKGYVHHFFDDFVSKDFLGDFYVCGLKPMVVETQNMLLEKGVDKSRIIFERYS